MHDSSLESSEKEVIALRLLELRRRLGFTQGVMAAKLGVSDRTYKYYEQGQRDAPLLFLIQTAALAQTDLNWLLTGETREIHDLDLYDRALVAVLEELPKRGLPASSGRAVKLARQAYENALARGTTPEEEALRLASAWE